MYEQKTFVHANFRFIRLHLVAIELNIGYNVCDKAD